MSESYKDRMINEYRETKERYEKLHRMIVKYEAGRLEFVPDCSLELLKRQAKAMGEYLYILEVRAEIEEVTLVDESPTMRHGHWIKANDPMSSPFDTMKRCLCSECREWGAVTSYCPHCGAKMEEEDATKTG